MFIDFHGFALIFIDCHGFTLMLIDSHLFSWIDIDVLWFSWIRFSWIYADFHRFSLIFIDFTSPGAWVSGILWRAVASCGVLWGPILEDCIMGAWSPGGLEDWRQG